MVASTGLAIMQVIKEVPLPTMTHIMPLPSNSLTVLVMMDWAGM
jgi:hypothetical protein